MLCFEGTGAITRITQNFLYGDVYVQCAYEQILYCCSAVTQCPMCEISGCILHSVFSNNEETVESMEQTLELRLQVQEDVHEKGKSKKEMNKREDEAAAVLCFSRGCVCFKLPFCT